jgi:hypothetical protein
MANERNKSIINKQLIQRGAANRQQIGSSKFEVKQEKFLTKNIQPNIRLPLIGMATYLKGVTKSKGVQELER